MDINTQTSSELRDIHSFESIALQQLPTNTRISKQQADRRIETLYTWPIPPSSADRSHSFPRDINVTAAGATWLTSPFLRDELRSFQTRTGSVVSVRQKAEAQSGEELGSGVGPFMPSQETRDALTLLIRFQDKIRRDFEVTNSDAAIVRAWLMSARQDGHKALIGRSKHGLSGYDVFQVSKYSIPEPVLSFLHDARTTQEYPSAREAAGVVGDWYDLELTGDDATRRQTIQEQAEQDFKVKERHQKCEGIWRGHWAP